MTLALAFWVATVGTPAAAASSPEARWGPAESLGRAAPPEPFTAQTALASDGRGTALLATRVGTDESKRIVVFERRAGQPFGPPQTVSAEGPVALESLWVGRDGRAVLVWRETPPLTGYSRLFAAVRSPGGSFGPPEPVPFAGSAEYAVGASDSKGNVVVLFSVRTRSGVSSCGVAAECPVVSDIAVSRRPKGGSFTSGRRVLELAATQGDPVLDSRGDLLVGVAKTTRDLDQERLEVLRLPVSGGRSSRQRFSYFSADGGDVDLATDTRGNVVLAFLDLDYGNLRTSISCRGRRFEKSVIVARTFRGDVETRPGLPQVAVDRFGRRLVAFLGGSDTSGSVRVVESNREGRFGRARSVAPRGEFSDLNVAADDSGRATLVWTRFARGTSIEAVRRLGPGRFGRVATLASAPTVPAGDFPLGGSLVAGLGRYGATAAWERLEPGERLQEDGPLLESSTLIHP